MKYFNELMAWIAKFLKDMLDAFKKILSFYDNSKTAIDEAVSQMDAAE